MEETFNRETASRLSKLCRISCTEEEITKLADTIQKIVAHIDQLQEVDTTGIEPCYSVLIEQEHSLREDVVDNNLPREHFLANAPEHIGGMIRVPKVLT
jgi:aspartyl-tRNA(Asn)/glutamyl-tRNA(Gln) amidotransferase subunit C